MNAQAFHSRLSHLDDLNFSGLWAIAADFALISVHVFVTIINTIYDTEYRLIAQLVPRIGFRKVLNFRARPLIPM
jgi:hypothetical protein